MAERERVLGTTGRSTDIETREGWDRLFSWACLDDVSARGLDAKHLCARGRIGRTGKKVGETRIYW